MMYACVRRPFTSKTCNLPSLSRNVKSATYTHAFSPMEVVYGVERTGLPLRDYLRTLREAGLGSLPGAVIAAFLIGFISTLMQAKLPVDARPFRDAFVYAAVIVTLIWRPNGIFAPKARQRV